MVGNDKVPILCNYGGDFVIKSGEYMYEGGNTRLIIVCRSIKQCDLLLKVNEICRPIVISTVKYKYPDLRLDSTSLVLIINDDDVFNMMQVFPQSSAPVQLYAISALQSPSNSISTPIEDTCQEQGLQNGDKQVTQRAIHKINDTIRSPSQMVDASSNDADQCMSSHLHEVASAVVHNRDHDNGTRRKTLRLSSPSINLPEEAFHVVDNRDLDNGTHQKTLRSSSPSIDLHEEASPVMDNRDLDNGTHQKALRSSSPSINLHEEDNFVVENERMGVGLQPQINYTLNQGQEFRDGNAFDMALREHAIQFHFQYKPIRTDHNSCISAKCVMDGCLWHISASKVPDGPEFKIERFNEEHTHECTPLDCKNHRQASRNWVAHFIIRHRKLLKSTPKDIMKDIDHQYGIKVDYHKARRGRELALEEEHLGSYISDLSAYCDEIEKTNPGSFATIGFSIDGSFGVFIAYHATMSGFLRACRPIIKLYDRNLKGESHIWLLASGLDPNNDEFLLAYALVESSNKETWSWFCVQLASLLKDTQKITIVTKRRETSSDAVSSTFPCAHHCKEESSQDSFGIWTSDADMFQFWTDGADATSSSVISSLKRFHTNVMEIFLRRQTVNGSQFIKQLVTPYASHRLNVAKDSFLYYHVQSVHNISTQFSVRQKFGQSQTIHHVDIEQRKCSCHDWERQKFPCIHAVAALHRIGSNLFDYCECYTAAKYQEAYSEIIYQFDFQERTNKMPGIDQKKKRSRGMEKAEMYMTSSHERSERMNGGSPVSRSSSLANVRMVDGENANDVQSREAHNMQSSEEVKSSGISNPSNLLHGVVLKTSGQNRNGRNQTNNSDTDMSQVKDNEGDHYVMDLGKLPCGQDSMQYEDQREINNSRNERMEVDNPGGNFDRLTSLELGRRNSNGVQDGANPSTIKKGYCVSDNEKDTSLCNNGEQVNLSSGPSVISIPSSPIQLFQTPPHRLIAHMRQNKFPLQNNPFAVRRFEAQNSEYSLTRDQVLVRDTFCTQYTEKPAELKQWCTVVTPLVMWDVLHGSCMDTGCMNTWFWTLMEKVPTCRTFYPPPASLIEKPNDFCRVVFGYPLRRHRRHFRDYRTLIFPIINDDHFTLLVGNVEEQRWDYYNSLMHREKDKEYVQRFVLSVTHHLALLGWNGPCNWDFKHVQGLPQQENGVDCGIFVMADAEHAAEKRPIGFQQSDICYYRAKIVYDIYIYQWSLFYTEINEQPY